DSDGPRLSGSGASLRAEAIFVDSCQVPLQLRQSLPQANQRSLRSPHLSQSGFGNAKITLGPAAAFRCRVADSGRHQTPLFHPIEGRVHAAESDFPPAALFDFQRNRNAVSVVAEPHQSQKDHELELTEVTAAWHLFNDREEISRPPGIVPGNLAELPPRLTTRGRSTPDDSLLTCR